MMVDGVSSEMIDNTKAKYHYWDMVIARNTLENGTKEQIQKAYMMLKDPTIYAYAFYKHPRNANKPFKLYPYQDLIINDQHKRIFFAAANQIGKSITLCLKATTYAQQNPGHLVLMVSKTFTQSKDLLRQIKNFLQNSVLDYKYDVGDSETKTEIYFKHYDMIEQFDEKLNKKFTTQKTLPQSRIICVPATEAALGYAVDLGLEDEVAFYDNGEYFHNQILVPRTYTTKGQIMVFTNPNGQQGIGWKLWNNPDYHRYKFNFLDCPTNTQQEFDQLSRNLTREQIDSTMLAIFTNPEGGFITLKEREDMQEQRMSMIPTIITTPLYIFYDWAKSRDRTVMSVGIPVFNEGSWAPKVYVYHMHEYPQGTPYTKIIDEDLKDLVIKLGPKNIAMVGWDNTGVGKGLEDFVNRINQLGVQTMPVDFNLQNKSRIYTLYKLLVEQRRVKIPYIAECDKQLSMLRFQRTSRGYLQVHHENSKDRDDFPDSIAGLCSIIIQPESAPITVTII